MRQGWLSVPTALAAVLLLAPAAFAGTASVDGSTARFDAAPGEVNRITIDARASGVVFEGASVTAGAGCTQNALEAVCPGVTGVVVSLGDEDDKGDITPYSTLPVRIDGGPGDDDLEDGGGADELDGGTGDDMLVSYDGGDADVLSGGPGTDTAYYGQRFNALNFSLDDVANDGEAGEHDNVRSDVEHVIGGYEDDVLTGSPGDDDLEGGEGTDTIYGLGGDDVLDGWGGGSGDHLYGGEGDDDLRLECRTYADAGPGDDTISRGIEDCGGNTAIGGPGDDTADLTGGFDEGATVSLDDVADDGESGTDDFRSDIENLIGGSDGMTLIGSSGPNVITGGDGDDVLIGGGGADTLSGGDGFDVADYSDHTAPVTLTLDGVRNDGAAGEQDLIEPDVEDLRGGSGNDTLIGDDGDNVVDGGPGADVMRGGGGEDAVDYSAREHAVTANLDGAAGDGESGENDTIAADVEGIFGGDGADVLTGSAADGFLDGGPGNDTLADPGGRDDLDAGAGDDAIEAADGAEDEITCGAGTDRLHADAADDVARDCESVTRGTPAVQPPASYRPAPAPPTRTVVIPPRIPPADRTAPTPVVRVTAQSRGLALSVACDEACSVKAALRATKATAKALARRHVHAGGRLGSAALPVAALGARTLRLKLTATGRRAVARLAKGRYVLTVTVTDGTGNSREVRRQVVIQS